MVYMKLIYAYESSKLKNVTWRLYRVEEFTRFDGC